MVSPLLVVRHASYSTDYVNPETLNEDGRRELTALGEALRKVVLSHFIALTSTSRRALQSLEELRKHVTIDDVFEYPLLWGSYDSPENGYRSGKIQEVLGMIEKHKNGKPLLVMTHDDVCSDLLMHLVKEGYNAQPGGHVLVPQGKGECSYVHEKDKVIFRLPRDFSLLHHS